MKPVVRVNMISVLTACRNKFVSQFTRMAPPPPEKPIPVAVGGSSSSSSYTSNNNPCLDLYYHYHVGPDALSTADFHESLKQLLPLAWSYDPLTALKVICNFIDRRGDGGKKNHDKAFFTAAIWLHNNHPKTLACNLVPISGNFGCIIDLPRLLSEVLHGQAHIITRKEESAKNKQKAKERASALLRRRKTIHMANKAADRYEHDPDFRFLHDRVSDIFAECLKSDIENFQAYNEQEDQDQDQRLEITTVANHCPTLDSSMPHPHDLLGESIATKLFHPESSSCRPAEVVGCVDRLRKEVLGPLKKLLKPVYYGEFANRWGYKPVYKHDPPEGYEYMRKAKASNKIIDPGALLPHVILDYLRCPGFEKAAELQWKRMVEDLYLKQGKLKNWLVVSDMNESTIKCPMDEDLAALALGLLVPQLSEEPWKGKVVNHGQKPRLHLIQGEDLKSRWKFMGTLGECQDWRADFGKVFDLILEVAVNENLKPEQMVKKVLVLTSFKDHFTSSCWGETTSYEEIHTKFKDRGYGDVVPHLIIWNMTKPDFAPGRCTKQEPGVTLLSGFSHALVKSLLENDGEIGPNNVMEAAISGPGYQTLAVVD